MNDSFIYLMPGRYFQVQIRMADGRVPGFPWYFWRVYLNVYPKHKWWSLDRDQFKRVTSWHGGITYFEGEPACKTIGCDFSHGIEPEVKQGSIEAAERVRLQAALIFAAASE